MRYGLALLDVEKPGRYEGLEPGAVVKEWGEASLRVALCFPDVYEIGMSHLGLPILYDVLNRQEGVLAERAYAPWEDMEALLRRNGWPLVTRESGRALREFDLVGFTLQYELSATNVLTMLDLGGIPLWARERGEADPLVVAGGPVASNPEPLADFFDAFFVGEGEEAVVEIARELSRVKGLRGGRASALQALARVEGVYVPSRTEPLYQKGRLAGFDPPMHVRRRALPDLAGSPVAERPLVGFIAPVHERLGVELARGCTRGCRFCQASFLYRPVRERAPEAVREAVRTGLSVTGYEEVGLLSLSTGDYSCVGSLLASLMDAHAPDRVSVSLPSLRVDTLDERLLEEVGRVRKSGFTIAPEAGTERLRRVINKNISEADILSAAEKIFAAGWKGIKLYFMIGLPTETEDDWHGIVDLARKVARLAPTGRGRVGVSISNFVPKPHTPFQWCRQVGPDEIRRAQDLFKRELRERKIELKWHSAEASALEGVLARGDRRMGAVVYSAYRKGCRMDGWTDRFRWERWERALGEAGLTLEEAFRERSRGEPLPWDGVDVGVARDFLWTEWEKARVGESTGDCRGRTCLECGVCDFASLAPRVVGDGEHPRPAEGRDPVVRGDPAETPRLRFRFRKVGPAGLLSHLETVASLHRAFRAAGVAIVYSQGFNPHPRLTLGPALRLGIESLAELGEVRVWEVPPLAEIQQRINRGLPEGLQLDAIWLLTKDTRGLTGGDTREEYRIEPSEQATASARIHGGWSRVVDAFWSSRSVPVVKHRPNKSDRVLEARDFVEALIAEGEALELRLRRRADGTMLGPEDFVHTLARLPQGTRACRRILKTRSQLS